MHYDHIVSTLQTMLEIPLNQADANFTRILPAMFLYAEGRIYGDLQFLHSLITIPGRLIALSREFELPRFLRVLEHVAVCTPAGPISISSKRTVLERITPVALDMFWPQSTFKTGLPQKYALLGGTPQATLFTRPAVVPAADPPTPNPQIFSIIMRLMPTPDRNYYIEMTGVIRPDTLSPINNETILTFLYPELFICACMVFACGYQRDFGAQADDPARAQSWNGQYQMLLANILAEVERRRGEGPGYTALPAAPMAQQPRAP